MDKPFARTAASITAAVVATMLSIVVDGIIIGRFLGPDCMAAYGLATPVINLASVFSGVLSTGSQVMCARYLGMGKPERARTVFSMTMVVAAIVSIVLVAVVLIFPTDLAVALGARYESAYLLPLVTDYLLGLSFALPSIIFLFVFNVLLRLDDDAGRVTIAVLVMTALDIAGDLVNVLVLNGGMFGMGLTSTISYLVAFVIMATHFTRKDIIFRFSFKDLGASDLRDILATGSSSAVGSVSAMLRNILLNAILVSSALSATAVGAFGVMNTVLGFTSCLIIGIGLATAMYAGKLNGKRDRSSVEALVRQACKAALLVGAVLGAIVFFGADVIASIFGGDKGQEMVTVAARALRFYGVSVVLFALNNTFVSFTQGLRRMAYSNVFSFLENYAFIAISALALSGIIGADAVWASFVIGELLTLACIVGLAAYLKRGVPRHMEDFLFLKETNNH